ETHRLRRPPRRPRSPPLGHRGAGGRAAPRDARRPLDARERRRRRLRVGGRGGAPARPDGGRGHDREPDALAADVRVPPRRRARGAERRGRGRAARRRRDPRPRHQRREAARRARRRRAPRHRPQARDRPSRAERGAARERGRRRRHRLRHGRAGVRLRAAPGARDHPGDRARALHRAAHRHRRLPVQQHLAALPRHRRPAPRGRHRPRGDVPPRVRERLARQAATAPRRARHAGYRRRDRARVDHGAGRGDGAVRPPERGPRRDRRAPPLDRGHAARAVLPRPRPRQGQGVVPQHGHGGRQRLRPAVRRRGARQGGRRARDRPARRRARPGGGRRPRLPARV
ncbi:MAG: RecJ, partial [uncultured Gemmatimonadaceae bacterium]